MDSEVMKLMKIISVMPLDGYKIRVKFEDGVEGISDLSSLVGRGVFARFADACYFNQAFINPETDTVTWPGGLDICPDSLYEVITGKKIFGVSADERRIA